MIVHNIVVPVVGAGLPEARAPVRTQPSPPPEPAAGGLPPLLRRRPAAPIGPGLGLAMPPCPDGAAHGRLGLRSAARHRRCPRRPHRPWPGTGHTASPGRCKTQVTRTGARVAPGPTARLPHRLGPGTGTAAQPCRCKTQVTRIAVGDREHAAYSAGVGDPPSSPARAGAGTAAPLGRCKLQVTRIAVGDCGLAALISPGPGPALPPRPDGAPANGWPAAGRLGRGPGGRAARPPPHTHSQQARLSAQPCSPSVDGATRQPQREAADV